MTELDDVRRELSEIHRRLLALADDDFAERHELFTRRDRLRAIARGQAVEVDEQRPDEELVTELDARRRQLETIEESRIDLVSQHGSSHGTSTGGGDGWGAVQLNRAIDEARDADRVRDLIRRLESIVADRGVDIGGR